MATPLPLSTVIALAAAALVASSVVAIAQSADETRDPAAIGSAPPADLVKAWNIDISPDGANLPDGSGSVPEGQGGLRRHLRGLSRGERGRRRWHGRRSPRRR